MPRERGAFLCDLCVLSRLILRFPAAAMILSYHDFVYFPPLVGAPLPCDLCDLSPLLLQLPLGFWISAFQGCDLNALRNALGL
jgi:hypothetical protein